MDRRRPRGPERGSGGAHRLLDLIRCRGGVDVLGGGASELSSLANPGERCVEPAGVSGNCLVGTERGPVRGGRERNGRDAIPDATHTGGRSCDHYDHAVATSSQKLPEEQGESFELAENPGVGERASSEARNG